MTFRVPATELTTEQLHSRLSILSGTLEMMDAPDWAASYGEEFAEVYRELDRRLSNNEILPEVWRWARTP